MSRPVDAVIEFLKAEQDRGVTHVTLDDAARAALNQLHALSGSKPAPMVQAAPKVIRETVSLETLVEEVAPTPAPQVVTASLTVTGSNRVEKLNSLRAQAETWQPARSLGTLRETMVFAVGNPDAKLMLVGEAPGYNEEKEREPFVGPAGQKLNDILKAMGIARADVYISNIVKFRPAIAKQSTNNRAPSIEEMAACLPFVREEIRIIQPQCIVALGGTAAKGLLGLTDSISALRGKWHEFENVPVRVTYHPSYLLRTEDIATKRLVWEDMLEAMEKLQLPISDKQRGYFLKK